MAENLGDSTVTRFTPKTEAALRTAGWFPGRNVSTQFTFTRLEHPFPNALEVMREFGYLILFKDQKALEEEEHLIWMDIGDSISSLKVRCQTFGEDASLESVERNREKMKRAERHDDLSLLKNYYRLPFARLCYFLDMRIMCGGDLYMSETGRLYVIEDMIPRKLPLKGFDGFLNFILDPVTDKDI